MADALVDLLVVAVVVSGAGFSLAGNVIKTLFDLKAEPSPPMMPGFVEGLKELGTTLGLIHQGGLQLLVSLGVLGFCVVMVGLAIKNVAGTVMLVTSPQTKAKQKNPARFEQELEEIERTEKTRLALASLERALPLARRQNERRERL